MLLGYYLNAQLDRISVLYYRDELSVSQAIIFCAKVLMSNVFLFILLSMSLYSLELLTYEHLYLLHNLSVLAIMSIIVKNPPATYAVENLEESYG